MPVACCFRFGRSCGLRGPENESELNLKVARAFLDQVPLDLAGRENPDWNPPDITNEQTDSSECQRSVQQ